MQGQKKAKITNKTQNRQYQEQRKLQAIKM